MADASNFDEYTTAIHNAYWSPSSNRPTAIRAILCTGSSAWDETASAATVVGTEIAAGNGYTTNGVTVPDVSATFDAAQDRAEGRPAAVTFSASGGAIIYDAFVTVATINGSDSLATFVKYGSAQTIGDGESRQFNIANNFGNPSADVLAAD